MPEFDENFWNADGRQLNKPTLSCLVQDPALYTTLLFQVREDISYNNHGIWMTDGERAAAKFHGFFDLALAERAALAVTPEYSCPWTVIGERIKNDRLCPAGDLWIVGAQSITAEELDTFIEGHPEVTWICEDDLINQHRGDGQFFDPVCLVLETTDYAGQPRKVVIVQFKNLFFGGGDFIWERDNLIRGAKFYVLSNRVSSVRLVTQICSDALLGINYNEVADGYFLNTPLLIVHIQLNQRPFQTNYKNYRNLLFAAGGKDSAREVLCLNWGRGVNIDGHPDWNVYGGSAFYVKTDQLQLSDARIDENHLLGLYYNHWPNRRSHIYFLGYQEQVFRLRNTKTSQLAADPAQMRRTGPQLTGLYTWDNGWQAAAVADDGFGTLCNLLEPDAGDISCLRDQPSAIAVERLLELTLGTLDPAPDWHHPAKLSAFQVGDDEFTNRTNFTHDPSAVQTAKREERLMNYGFLKHTILGNADNLPPGLKDAILEYEPSGGAINRHLLNLRSESQPERKATGIYLGLVPAYKAAAVRDRVVNLFTGGQQGKQVLVWYLAQGGLITQVPQLVPEIADNTTKPTNSYKKTKS
ncbi:hypothetical protein [Mucilaginibacter aquatilis]|uniref:Uncharacterized protein n=1 Tax=Mucilaginibacter aquatilis TaxID=1517760 RepID=A0A6I4I911_9SPHI|nr:hypothetical protein [Mucilaginibacter aquatilis]MVN91532.1 hypothetical protein [Mucilaginibacter aquatilis]